MSQTPHVCFKKEADPPAERRELPGALSAQFANRFSSVKRVLRWFFFSKWIWLVKRDQTSFLVGLKKSKFVEGEWILQVGLMKARSGHPHDLLLACREIHATLTGIAGVSAIRWYFEDLHSQSGAATTPDHLPWVESKG
jgi:hypothetical protein